MDRVFVLVSTFRDTSSTAEDVRVSLYKNKEDALKAFVGLMEDWLKYDEYNEIDPKEVQKSIDEMKKYNYATFGNYTHEIRDSPVD